MKTRSASGRIKAVKYEEDVINGDVESEARAFDRDESSDDDPRPSKKGRWSYASSPTKARRGSIKDGKEKGYRGRNIGKLSKLLDMPVDILCEIAAHLEPLDVLRLARSTRDFNQILMSRESRPIWRAARSFYPDLPNCPPDLSEPGYARLLFERECHVCLAPRAMKVDWVLRSRLCHRCRITYLVQGTSLLDQIPDLTEELLECFPCRSNYRSRTRCRRREFFYSIRVEAFVAKYRAAVPKTLPEDQAKVLREQFMKQQKELIPVIVDHAQSVMLWLSSDREAKVREGNMTIVRRKTELCNRLLELGYNEDDFPVYSPDWHQIMSQPRDVTPRIWNSVRPKLEDCIKRSKTQWEEAARHSRKARRRSELAMYIDGVILARKAKDERLYVDQSDVWTLPAVEAVLAENDYERKITEETWNGAKEQIEKEMDEFSENVATQLIQDIIARKAVASSLYNVGPDTAVTASSQVDVDYLLLPSTFFECIECWRPWQYPSMLLHTHGWCTAWRAEKFHFNVSITSLAETILASMHGQGDFHDSREFIGSTFQCLRCDENISSPLDWRSLITHFESEQSEYDVASTFLSTTDVTVFNDHDINKSDTPLAIILTPEESAAQVKVVNAFTFGKPRGQKCGLCEWGGWKTKEEVAVHIKHKHFKDELWMGTLDENKISRLVV